MHAADILKKRSPLLLNLFSTYVHYYFRRHFNAVRINQSKDFSLQNKALIIYTNHPSWWDPLLYILLDKKIFTDRISFGPMDADSLKNHQFMQKLGIFGVSDQNYAGQKNFLQISRTLLNKTNTILWITAEGQFSDPRVRPVQIKPGIAHLIKNNQEILILPLAIEYPFWTERKPEVLIKVGNLIDSETLYTESIKTIHHHLQNELNELMDQLAIDSQLRDQSLYKTLLFGSTGINCIYDGYKTIKAKITGNVYHSQHSEISHDRNIIDR